MIQRTWRIALLFLLMAVVLLKLGSSLGPQGWLWGSVILLSFWVMVIVFPDIRLPQVLRGTQLEGQDPWGLFEELSLLCKKARLPLPKVYLFNSSTPTALTFGRSWRSSYMFVTESLLTTLSRDELRAVLALELAKIKRLDILPQTLATGLTGWDLWLHKVSADPSDSDSKKIGPIRKFVRGAGAFLKNLPLPPAARAVVRFCVGSQAYFQSDQLASEYVGGPEAIANVLWKLESYSLNDPLSSPRSLRHLFVVEPIARHQSATNLRSQPTVRRRIEHLVGHYPV